MSRLAKRPTGGRLGVSAVLAATALLVASPAGQAKTLSMCCASYSTASTVTGSGSQAMVAELGRRVPSLRVDVRVSATYGSENQILEAVRLGALDFTTLTGSIASDFVPELGLVDIPFLFRDSAHAKAVLEGPIGEEIAAKFREKGVMLLAFGEQGFRHLTNAKRPVQTPADLKGLKIRVLPNEIYRLTFATLGAEAVPLPFPEVYAALRDGRLDGQENPTSVTLSGRLVEVQKFMTLTAHFYSTTLFLMNRESFEALTAEEQRAVREAARIGAEATRTAAAESKRRNIETVKKQGVQVTEAVDREAFVKALAPAMPELERRFGADTIARIRATR